MANKKTHVALLQTHPAEIDALVGERKRSALLSEVAAREVRRHRLLEVLNRDAPVWDPADHPDIEEAGGAAAWVRKLRHEAEKASRRRMRPKRG
ncbi:MAG: hypothetical protein ABSE93_26780 [Terriglobia bacterium]|jgi:hypothetical protein